MFSRTNLIPRNVIYILEDVDVLNNKNLNIMITFDDASYPRGDLMKADVAKHCSHR